MQSLFLCIYILVVLFTVLTTTAPFLSHSLMTTVCGGGEEYPLRQRFYLLPVWPQYEMHLWIYDCRKAQDRICKTSAIVLNVVNPNIKLNVRPHTTNPLSISTTRPKFLSQFSMRMLPKITYGVLGINSQGKEIRLSDQGSSMANSPDSWLGSVMKNLSRAGVLWFSIVLAGPRWHLSAGYSIMIEWRRGRRCNNI
jgi:hypothetical protein